MKHKRQATKEEQKAAAQEKRKGQRLLKATLGSRTASAEQKAVLELYESEGKSGSAVKDALLQNFLADKSCKWCHEIVESRLELQELQEGSLHGHATRWQVAKELGLDTQDPQQALVLEAVLEELPKEGAWDESVPLERGYARAGVVRYRLDMKVLSRFTKTDRKTSGVQSTKHRYDSKHVSALQASKVKVEISEGWSEWVRTYSRIKGALAALTKLIAAVSSIQLSLEFHLEGGKTECRGLS